MAETSTVANSRSTWPKSAGRRRRDNTGVDSCEAPLETFTDLAWGSPCAQLPYQDVRASRCQPLKPLTHTPTSLCLCEASGRYSCASSGALSARESAEACVDAGVERIADIGKDRTYPRRNLSTIGVVGRQSVEHELRATQNISGAEHDASNAAQKQRTKAHQTRLEAGVASHLPRPRPQRNRYSSKRFLFGMAARLITVAQNTCASLCHTAVFESDDATDRDIPTCLSFECELDPSFDEAHVQAGP